MAAFTTARLLTSVERKSFSPENQSTYNTADILAIADEVSKTEILPAILAVREEFFATYVDQAITSGINTYSLPARSIGMIAREISIVDSNGKILKNLPRTSTDRLDRFFSDSGNPDGFLLRGNDVVLVPTPSTTQDYLRIEYFIHPGDLVETTETAVIATIDTVTNVITVTTIPSAWVTGNSFDLIKKDGGHEYRATGLTASLVSGTSITLPSLPVGLSVGDYVALEGQSSLIQLPPDFQPILADFVAAEMIMGMSQPQGEKLYQKAMKRLETAQKMIAPRVQGEDELILPEWD